MKKTFKNIANLLCVVLSILLLIAMLILCIIEIYSYFTCKAVININEAWSCVFSGIIGSLLSCLCVLIGFSITDRSKKIDNQLKLREMFSQELRWEVHRTLETEDISYWENKSGSKSVLLLNDENWWQTDACKKYFEAALDDYMGLFEIAYKMLEKGQLSKSDFKMSYYFRLKKITECKLAMNKIKGEECLYWKQLSKLIDMFAL